MKSLLEHSVQLNAALFYTTYADRLYLFQQLTGSMITDLTTNIGPSTNYGAEFDIAAPLPGGFKFSGGIGVLHATWGDVKNYVDPVTGLPRACMCRLPRLTRRIQHSSGSTISAATNSVGVRRACSPVDPTGTLRTRPTSGHIKS